MLKLKIRPYLDDLKSRKTTNRAVAAELRVSEEHVSRVLKALKLEKDPAPDSKADTKARKALLAARKALRTQVASTHGIKEAAKLANCSERTIYRFKSCLKATASTPTNRK